MNRKKSYFKKTFALLMAVMMIFTMMPSMAFADSVDEGVSTQADNPKIVVTSNVEFATSGDSTTVTDKPLIKVMNATNNEIDKTKQQSINVSNYHKIKDKFTLEYVEIDGLKIYLSQYEQAGKKMVTLNRSDSDCPNLNGREIWYRMADNNYPQTQLRANTGDDITNDISIYFHFTTETKQEYKLTIAESDKGQVYESKFQRVTDEGKSLYSLRVRPNDGQELVSYTIGETTVPFNLTRDNYVVWYKDGTERVNCNYVEVEIEKDSEITLNYQAATMDLQFWACDLADIKEELVANWSTGGLYPMRGTTGDNEYGSWGKTFAKNNQLKPLVEGVPTKFWFVINFNGFLAPGTECSTVDSIKIYNGDKVDSSKLIFDDEDPEVLNRGGEASFHVTDLRTDSPGGIYCSIMKCPDLKQITVVVHWGGYSLQKTFDVPMANDLQEVKDFTAYYTDTYGLDKQGQEVYTAEEKQTDGYKTYCKYKNFRYVLRQVYNEYATKIAMGETEADREKLLAEGKQKLDDASVGKGYNAVVWSFKGSTPVMVAVPNDVEDYTKHPSPGTTAEDSMMAALEATAPGNWTYYYSGSQFGSFVNNLTWGGADEKGTIHVNIKNYTSYGYWYYNGKFSDWGVSNYNPYDGDVMYWGGGSVDQYWDWAKLRLYYGDDDTLAAEAKKRGINNIAAASAEEIETAFADLSDGSGKDFFRRSGQFRDVEDWESVVSAIGAIGSVSPDSGDKIKAARDAYDALSDADKAKVSNYQTLVDAEEAYKALTEGTSTSFENALAGVLAYFNNEDTESGVGKLGVASTKGEWAVLSLARNGIINGKDTSGQAVNYLAAAETAIANDSLKSSTDFARMVIALSSLGVEAPQKLITGCCDFQLAKDQGINAVSYALMALDSKPYTETNAEKVRKQYVDYILSDVCKDGGWILDRQAGSVADTDITAIVIQALAPYYNDENAYRHAQVVTAVDNALKAMAKVQKSTGGFEAYGGLYNAESTAQMIVALCSVKKDPTTWNEKNAVNALLHFYNSSDNMFAHQLAGLKDQMATEQSAYALIAYNRFKNDQNTLYDMSDAFAGENGAATDPAQAIAAAKLAFKTLGTQTVSMKVANTEDAVKTYITTRLTLLGITGVRYDITFTDFTAATAGSESEPNGTSGNFKAVVTAKAGEGDSLQTTATEITGTITSTAYQAPSSDISVTISLLGDDEHGENGTTHTLKNGGLKTWISKTTVTVPGGSTVADALTAFFSKKGVIVENVSGNYISAITYNGVTIGEFTNGKNSGWMYTLNGSHPEVGIAGQLLQNGDVIVFHYTDDYTVEEGSEKWNTGDATEVKNVTSDKTAGTTTSPTEVKVTETINADGTKETVANVTVSADNQKEILAQAKSNKSKEIILQVSKDSVKDATKVDVQLEKSFIESVASTGASLTVKTPLGDKTYTNAELKDLATAAATGKTVSIEIVKSEKTDEELRAEQLEAAKTAVAKASVKARSSKTTKGDIKVVFKPDTKTQKFINEMKDMGYTVKYRFYRSTKKSSGYKSMLTKSGKTYINTTGKSGTRYYYKVQVRVYDENGKCVAKTALKQCRYATRTWTK